MEKTLVNLFKEGNVAKLKVFIKEQKIADLQSAIEKTLFNSKDPLTVTKAIFQGLDADNRENADNLVSLFKHLLTILGKPELNNKLADDAVFILLMECNKLTGPSLAELAQHFIDSVKNGTLLGGKALNVFPKILTAIAAQDAIAYGDSTLKGTEFKSHVINSLCSSKWSAQTVIHLAAMFSEVPLTLEELKFVLEKIIRQFDDLDLRDIPALIYQLLLLSEKGHRRLILEGISSFFIAKDSLARSQSNMMDSDDLMEDSLNLDLLRQTEGTAILHVSFAVMEQRELRQDFLKYIKTWQNTCASKVLSPFNLALALSVAGMNVLNEQIMDFLKSVILQNFRDHHRHTQSYWVRENFPEQLNIEQIVLETVVTSSTGWEHVVQGLVQLGFLLMDSFGPRLVFGKPEMVVAGKLTPNQVACQLGSKILIKMFKGHEIVRSDILGQIFNRVMTETSAPASRYLNLLSDIVTTAPLFMLDSVGKVREVFDCLPMLPLETAQGMLAALLPLLKVSMSLKDSLILLLRKSIFSRQLEECKVGLQGYLAMLRSFKVLGGMQSSQLSQSSQVFASSQIPVDVHSQYNRSSNEALCLEILGILKRCLSLQADIRLSLYQGLVDVLSRNTQLKSRILDMLHTQINKYYELSEDAVPPLKLQLCITASGENVFLAEPLAHLLSCIQQCVHRVRMIRMQVVDDDQHGSIFEEGDDEENSAGVPAVEEILNSLTTRIIQTDLEDFELDKAADFSTANSVGVRNNIFAILLLGTYEVLMEHNFASGNFSVVSCEQVTQLFSKYKSLCDTVREKAGGGGKKGRHTSKDVKTPCSLLSLRCVVAMLEALFGDDSAEHRQGLEILRSSPDFSGHVTAVALQKLQQIVEKGTCDGANCSPDKLFSSCCTLGRLFMSQYMENHQVAEGRERAKKLVSSCLEGLEHVFTLAHNRGHDDVKRCLAAIVKSEEEEPDIHSHIKRYQEMFQRLVNSALNADEEQRHIKDVGGLMAIISILSSHLPPSGPHYEQVFTWVKQLCTDGAADDVGTCKLLLGSLLKMAVQMKTFPQLLRECMEDLHSQLGDIEKDVEVEDRTHFALINARTAAPTVVTLLLPYMDRDLDDTDWVICRMKADCSQQNINDADMGPTQQESFEKLVCARLAVLVGGLHELSQSAIPPGPCVAAVFKTLTKFYTTVLTLVKYYLQLYATRSGHMSNRFEKLVKVIGMQLTPFVYSLITYAQLVESELIANCMQEKELKKKKPQKSTQKDKTQVKKSKTATVRGGKNDSMIPNLIFSIEELERHLVKLSKKTKVNLMENIKSSTARDFRINVKVVQESLHISSDDSDENKEENDHEDENAEQASANARDVENVDPENEGSEEISAEVSKELEPAPKRRRFGKLQKAK